MLIPFFTRDLTQLFKNLKVLYKPPVTVTVTETTVNKFWAGKKKRQTQIRAVFILRILEQWVFHTTTPTTTVTTASRQKQIRVWEPSSIPCVNGRGFNMHFHPHCTSALTKEIIKKGLEFLAVSPYNGCKTGAHIRYREKCLPVTYS